MDIDFEHKKVKYRAVCSASDLLNPQQTMGCHSRVVAGLGQMMIQSLYYFDKKSTLIPIKTEYDPWGNVKLGWQLPIQERFSGEAGAKELKDIVYKSLTASYSYIGIVIFSDHVNAESKQRPGAATKQYGEYYGPAALAKWIHENRKTVGPVYASPICGNPMHRSAGAFSLVQVFTWIPKANEWSIASDLGEIPCPRDPEFTSEKFFNSTQLKQYLGHDKTAEVLKEELKVTYA